MRIPTIILPLLGAGGGLLLGSVYALVFLLLCALTGTPTDPALRMAEWGVLCGVIAGALVGTCRAIDCWLSAFTGRPGSGKGKRTECRQKDRWAV
jgi:hypothetical protein